LHTHFTINLILTNHPLVPQKEAHFFKLIIYFSIMSPCGSFPFTLGNEST
jgi:hypothetical protein